MCDFLRDCFSFLFSGSNKETNNNQQKENGRNATEMKTIYNNKQKMKQNEADVAIYINQTDQETKYSPTLKQDIQSLLLIPQQTYQESSMEQQGSFNHQQSTKPIIKPSNSKPDANILPNPDIKPSPELKPKPSPFSFIKPLPKLEPQKMFSLKEIQDKPQNVILLIGSEGQRKTQIFQSLKTQTNEILRDTFVLEDDKDFTFLIFEKFIVFNTPPFELADDIDMREKTIKKFSPVFKALHRQIQAFVIVAKFERTDIMKKNIMDSYKFLQTLKEQICLMISDFHLSENKKQDRGDLQERLKYFVQDQDQSKILFYDQRDQKGIQGIKQKFEEIADNKRPSLKFKYTMFEEQSSFEARQLQQELSSGIMNQCIDQLTTPLIWSN